MPIRPIIEIDEALCNGCGECIVSCEEGALALVDGKARVVRDSLCDGLGACLGHCPTGALRIIQREAAPFELDISHTSGAKSGLALQMTASCAGSCPGSRLESSGGEGAPNWPVQLRLTAPNAPLFAGSELVLAADCAPAAMPLFHRTVLQGRPLLIACPKLDDAQDNLQRLTALLAHSGATALYVIRMEVPCCGGLSRQVLMAHTAAQSDIAVYELTISRTGALLDQRALIEPTTGGVQQ